MKLLKALIICSNYLQCKCVCSDIRSMKFLCFKFKISAMKDLLIANIDVKILSYTLPDWREKL